MVLTLGFLSYSNLAWVVVDAGFRCYVVLGCGGLLVCRVCRVFKECNDCKGWCFVIENGVLVLEDRCLVKDLGAFEVLRGFEAVFLAALVSLSALFLFTRWVCVWWGSFSFM